MATSYQEEISRAEKKLRLTLNTGQRQALMEILESVAAKRFHLLIGNAGTGKTVVMQVLAALLSFRKKMFAMTAPTHAPVKVLGEKMKANKINDVDLCTIQSLLTLRPKPSRDKLVFQRPQRAKPVYASVVGLDECSMLGEDIMQHIERWLGHLPVIFCGDDAQLPPVGEAASRSFKIAHVSRLTEPRRQDADNPLLIAAYAIRDQQGGAMNFDWLKPARLGNKGIFLPGDRADDWMRKAFTSPDFNSNPNTFRYLAWTNARVAAINNKIRGWRYGAVDTPFVPGEKMLLRSNVKVEGSDDAFLAHTNEEPEVLAIEPGRQTYDVSDTWQETIATWLVKLRNDDGLEFDAHLVRDTDAYGNAIERIASANRWEAYHGFKDAFILGQSIYAMTVHTSQGSTHTHDFMDVGDISRRVKTNVLEAQQLLYVASTRPTNTLNAVGL